MRVNYISIIVLILLFNINPFKNCWAEECLPDSPPKSEIYALKQLNLQSNDIVHASKVGDWGWKFEWKAGNRFVLKLPRCVCVDYNQQSSKISGVLWKEKRGPYWTRALINKNGGKLNTPGGATVYWSECMKKKQ